MKWINVGDKVPDESEIVLICAHEYNNKYKPIFMDVAIFSRNTFYDVDHRDSSCFADYWMPLPEPPKE